MVLPFLIAAMAASHAAQVIKRFMEDAAKLGNSKDAAKSVIQHLFTPAFASIITEAGGLIVIALVPIPILNKICIACCYWAFITVVIDMILVPITAFVYAGAGLAGQERVSRQGAAGLGQVDGGLGQMAHTCSVGISAGVGHHGFKQAYHRQQCARLRGLLALASLQCRLLSYHLCHAPSEPALHYRRERPASRASPIPRCCATSPRLSAICP